MTLTATDLRKNLFQILERAAQGENVEVLYKGSVVNLSASVSSKLARAKRQHAIVGDPDSLVSSDPALVAEMESEWQKDWTEI